MNDSELEKHLKAVPVPERTGDYWESFPRRVRAELHSSRLAARPQRRRRLQIAWAVGLAAACLAIGFFLGHRPRQPEMLTFLQDGKALREVLTLFPNRVRAIVQDEHGVQLLLSDKPDVPNSPPLWLSICDGKRCRAVVTFSGQNLQIAGEEVEVLADAQGRVMLMGDRLFWSSATSVRMADLRIQARQLTYAM